MAARDLRRRWRPQPILRVAGLLLALAALTFWSVSCGDDGMDSTPEPPQQQSQEEQITQQQEAPLRERVLEIPEDVVGAHLTKQPIEAGLSDWLLAARDPVLAELPERALFASGNLYSAASDSPTNETFWLHIYTDDTFDGATQWVEYVAAQSPAEDDSLPRELVRHHDRYTAMALPDPGIGDASLAVQLLHGHSGICVRSQLIVFAQDGVIVFLFTSIEITGESSATAQTPSGAADNCDISLADAVLTDTISIARWISGWLIDVPSSS